MARTQLSFEQIKGNVVSVKDYGAVGDGVTDDTAAIQAAINHAETVLSSLFFPSGTYKVTGELFIGKGVPLVGEYNSATLGVGTSIKHFSAGNLFNYDGSAVSGAQNTGGGISKMLIVKANGYSGGEAIKVYNSDNDGDTNKRASTFNFEELTIQTDGTGLWSRGLHLDGAQYNTAGSRGLRNFSIYKVRISGCTSNYEYAYFNQVTHLTIDLLQIDTGSGTGSTGLTFTGYNENVNITNSIINGRFYIPAAASAMLNFVVSGKISEIQNDLSSAQGVFLVSAATVNNNSNTVCVLINAENRSRYFNAGPVAGFSDRAFSTFSGTTELSRLGHASNSIQTLKPTKNDGQYWIYANGSAHESSPDQIAYKFEKTRFRPSDDGIVDLGYTTNKYNRAYVNQVLITDGISAPATEAGHAALYIDSGDGDLKIKFGDGTVKTIVTDT